MFTRRIHWDLSAGFYIGVLLGFRVYHSIEYTTYVLYLPFFDLALAIENEY